MKDHTDNEKTYCHVKQKREIRSMCVFYTVVVIKVVKCIHVLKLISSVEKKIIIIISTLVLFTSSAYMLEIISMIIFAIVKWHHIYV